MTSVSRAIRSLTTLAATVGTFMAQACGDSSGVEPARESQLAFLTQPSTAESQAPMTPAIRVALQDASGNTVATASREVTIVLAQGPVGAALSGTANVRAANGIATFSDLSVNLPGDGFVLEARSAGLSTSRSTPFSARLTFVQAVVGQVHSCASTQAGFAFCWGNNSAGQLGDGGSDQGLTPQAVRGGARFRQLSATAHHACGVSTDDAGYCWGDNPNGLLGDGTADPKHQPTPVTGGLRLVEVSTGGFHTCALSASRDPYCWGMTFGDALVRVQLTPTLVEGGLRFLHIAAGNAHTCGVTADSVAYCWGGNGGGQLGDGTAINRVNPTLVAGGLKFLQVSAGYGHTCGIAADSTAYCWGFGGEGELGDGTTGSRFSPAPVAGSLKFAQVSAGTFQYGCGITADQAAYCWGYGADGQLGNGTASARLMPTPVAGGLAFRQISAGTYHTCAITPGNAAYCWGVNDYGELGDGTTTRRLTPTLVAQGPTP